MQDPLGRETLERPDRPAVVAELGVVVVLDDQRILVLGPLEQRRATLRGHHRARRKLMRGSDHRHLAAGVGERVYDDAPAVDLDRDRLEPRLGREHAVPAPPRIRPRRLFGLGSKGRRGAHHEARARVVDDRARGDDRLQSPARRGARRDSPDPGARDQIDSRRVTAGVYNESVGHPQRHRPE